MSCSHDSWLYIAKQNCRVLVLRSGGSKRVVVPVTGTLETGKGLPSQLTAALHPEMEWALEI